MKKILIWFMTVMIFVALAAPVEAASSTAVTKATREKLDIPLTKEEFRCAYTWSKEYSVPLSLTLAIIEQESGFDHNCDGYCTGYMQISDVALPMLAEIGVYDLKDPLQNIHGGIYILSYWHHYLGSESFYWALEAYNGYSTCGYAESVLLKADTWKMKLEDYSLVRQFKKEETHA